MNKYSAFTLLELSIVIVIIGLIVAGISAGQSLVRQAAMRGVTSDVEQIKLMLNSFKLQYDAMPGDMSNADSYWSGCGVGATAAQCNGNDDNVMDWGSVDNDREAMRAWQHLALAGIIDGSFSGEGQGGDGSAFSQVMRASAGNIIYNLETQQERYIQQGAGAARYAVNHSILIGNATSWWNAAFSVVEAQNIDNKIDDGDGNAGKLIGMTGEDISTATDCTAARTTVGGADYNLSTGGAPSCVLVYFLRKSI